jgi:hypothetical protein
VDEKIHTHRIIEDGRIIAHAESLEQAFRKMSRHVFQVGGVVGFEPDPLRVGQNHHDAGPSRGANGAAMIGTLAPVVIFHGPVIDFMPSWMTKVLRSATEDAPPVKIV